jgi:hypothetical protein
MTSRCADLDEFFDGELAPDQADEFRDHLGGCERCQRVLLGRMQEDLAAHVDVVDLHRVDTRPSAPPDVITPARNDVTPIRAPTRRGGLRRTVIYMGPALAAAAAAVTLWFPHTQAVGFAASIEFDRAPSTKRDHVGGSPSASPSALTRVHSAEVHDVVKLQVQGARHQAIWVYRDDRELLLSCPGDDAQCITAHGDLAIRYRLPTSGRFTIISLGSSDAIPPPQPSYEEAIVAARTAGASYRLDDINVGVPPR